MFTSPPIPEKLVLRKLLRLRVHKSTGDSLLCNQFLKRCAPFLASSITYLFNFSLSTCSLPSAWKLAKVIPLYKNRGSQSDPSNYRPISLLPAIGKVMDDIQSSRRLSFLTTNKLISLHQFGFVSRSSTVHQLVYIIDKWTRTRDAGSNFSATFMDFMKAFDWVWHMGLLYKLAQCGISSSSLAWIQDYLSNRYITVQVTAANLSQSPFLQECHKDLTSALYSLWSSLMTYHLTPNLLQLNFMLMMPSYTNCTPDAKNFLSCRCRTRLRQQKTGSIMAWTIRMRKNKNDHFFAKHFFFSRNDSHRERGNKNREQPQASWTYSHSRSWLARPYKRTFSKCISTCGSSVVDVEGFKTINSPAVVHILSSAKTWVRMPSLALCSSQARCSCPWACSRCSSSVYPSCPFPSQVGDVWTAKLAVTTLEARDPLHYTVSSHTTHSPSSPWFLLVSICIDEHRPLYPQT